MSKKIEGVFPLREINQLSMSERTKKGHPGNIHLWWNRSPVTSSSMLLEAILEDEQSEEEKEKTSSEVTIIDPFSGSGCLTLAALQSGMPVFAGDINSVAAVLTKAIAEIPYRFNNCSPVSPQAEICLYQDLAGLAEDIRCYGEWIREELARRLEKYYPDALGQEVNGKQVYAWVWTRTAPCPNPACNCTMPLASSYVISRQKGRECHVIPKVSDGVVSFDLQLGAPESSLNGNKIGKHGALFQCPACGTVTSDAYIKSMGISGKLGLRLMAVSYECADGSRTYMTAENEQMSAADSAYCADSIIGDIPDITRWFSPPLFGLKEYADLYTPRQLLLMSTLFDLIVEVQEQCRKDALAEGWSDDPTSLDEGGSGALAYSQAVAMYLSLAVSKMANYQSEICTWDNRTGNIRAAFTRQAIPMTWTFGEGNPFSSVTGNFKSMLADVVSTVEKLAARKGARVEKMDALSYAFPNHSLLFTELPYYDNVGYSDLSDYYYVWLRRGLKSIFPKLFDQVVSSKDELSSIPEHFGGDASQATETYNMGIQKLIRNFRNVAAAEYPSAIFFEFSKQDELALNGTSDRESAPSHLENLLNALLEEEFQITAILPVRTELPNDHYDTYRVMIVFRIRNGDAMETTRRAFMAELRREIPGILKRRFEVDIAPEDQPCVGLGCGLAMFSRYARVINADGSSMNIRDALQAIWTEVSQYLLSEKMKEENPNG